MHDERRTLERRPGKEHGLPEIVHSRQMRRPIYVRDVVENGSEDVVVPHAIVEDVHEARHVATIRNIAVSLIHITLPVNRPTIRARVSLRSRKEATSTDRRRR